MHPGRMNLHFSPSHECALRPRLKRIDQISQSQSFFRIHLEVLYISEVDDLRETCPKRRITAQRCHVLLNFADGNLSPELYQYEAVFDTDGIGGSGLGLPACCRLYPHTEIAP